MTRRGFLFAFIGGLLVAAGTRFNRTRGNSAASFERTLLVSGLTDLFEDVEAAVVVGEAYLRTLEGDDVLGHLLFGAGIEPRTPRMLRPAAFHRRREQDFLDGKTLLMEGWIMARSELCACGLLAISQRNWRTG